MSKPDKISILLADKYDIPNELLYFFWEVFDLYNIREKVGQYKGIVFEVRTKEGNHVRPHVHAAYNKYNISVSLDTFEVLAGNLPKKQERIACEWVKNNVELCQAKWDQFHLEKSLALTSSRLGIHYDDYEMFCNNEVSIESQEEVLNNIFKNVYEILELKKRNLNYITKETQQFFIDVLMPFVVSWSGNIENDDLTPVFNSKTPALSSELLIRLFDEFEKKWELEITH